MLKTKVLERKMTSFESERRQHNHLRVLSGQDPNRRVRGSLHLKQDGFTDIPSRFHLDHIAGLSNRHRRLEFCHGIHHARLRCAHRRERHPANDRQPNLSKRGHSVNLCL